MRIIPVIIGAAMLAACNPATAQTPTDIPPAAATPAPAPPPVVVQPIVIPPGLTPERFETEATRWIDAWQKVILAACTAAGVLALAMAALWSRVNDLRHRADRQAAKTGSLQEQMTDVAKAVPPPTAPPPPPTLAIMALVVPAFLFTSCAGLPPRSYSVYGRDAEGHELGAKVELGDTRLPAKKGYTK